MDEESKSLLKSIKLPDNFSMLLELYGLRTVEDLSQLDEATINEVVAFVRNGSLEEMVDMESKTNRIKYLGFNYTDLKTFKFAPFDLKKLKTVSGLADQHIERNASQT